MLAVSSGQDVLIALQSVSACQPLGCSQLPDVLLFMLSKPVSGLAQRRTSVAAGLCLGRLCAVRAVSNRSSISSLFAVRPAWPHRATRTQPTALLSLCGTKAACSRTRGSPTALWGNVTPYNRPTPRNTLLRSPCAQRRGSPHRPSRAGGGRVLGRQGAWPLSRGPAYQPGAVRMRSAPAVTCQRRQRVEEEAAGGGGGGGGGGSGAAGWRGSSRSSTGCRTPSRRWARAACSTCRRSRWWEGRAPARAPCWRTASPGETAAAPFPPLLSPQRLRAPLLTVADGPLFARSPQRRLGGLCGGERRARPGSSVRARRCALGQVHLAPRVGRSVQSGA